MSRQVTFDYSKAGSFISEEDRFTPEEAYLMRRRPLVSKTGAGS